MSDAVSGHGLRKSYRSGDRVIEVLRGAAHRGGAGRKRGHSRRIRLRQDHAAQPARRASTPPRAARSCWAGASVTGLSHNALAGLRARFLGMVFQAYYLIPEIDALANVLMARRMLGCVGTAERDRACDAAGPRGPGRARAIICRRSCPAANASAWPSPGR